MVCIVAIAKLHIALQVLDVQAAGHFACYQHLQLLLIEHAEPHGIDQALHAVSEVVRVPACLHVQAEVGCSEDVL